MEKPKKIRSAKHRRFIADLLCCVCGNHMVQAAHVRSNTGGGMGLKPCDSYCVPLCCFCHGAQHCCGERTFWAKKGGLGKAKKLAQALYANTGDKKMAMILIAEFR